VSTPARIEFSWKNSVEKKKKKGRIIEKTISGRSGKDTNLFTKYPSSPMKGQSWRLAAVGDHLRQTRRTLKRPMGTLSSGKGVEMPPNE